MADERVIPDSSVIGDISLVVLSDGTEVNTEEVGILSVTIHKEVNRIPTATLLIRDGSPAEENFEIAESDVFKPGNPIEIKLGRDGDNQTVFKGIIARNKVQFSEYRNPTFKVTCKDESIKLTLGRKNKYFVDSTDSDVISEILGSLAGDVESTSVTHKELVQHHTSDWDFILRRAESNGLLVVPDDGKVNIVKPDAGSSPVVSLIYGDTMYEFDAEINALNQWKSVKGQSWDYTNQALFEAEASSSSFQENGNINGSELADVGALENYELRHSGQVVQEELQAWVESEMLKSRLAKIVGQARFDGIADVKPATVIELNGVSDRFNGNVYVTGVRHEFIDNNWYTHAQFGLSEDWLLKAETASAPIASNLLPGVNGLQIGKVVQLEEDPDGEDRILVKVPVLDNAADGIWARIATLDAGENRGSFFRPEIDDEVVMGFLNADPRDPIVVGMLNSSAKPAPITAADDNHEKGFVTRSGMRFLFNDEDGKLSITLDTPGGNSMVFSEEDKSIVIKDQNDNSITLDPNGIVISSPKDITVEATGKIDIKATQDLSEEGLNVNIKAKTQLKAQGSAGAELSASGQTVVKGAMVMIN